MIIRQKSRLRTMQAIATIIGLPFTIFLRFLSMQRAKQARDITQTIPAKTAHYQDITIFLSCFINLLRNWIDVLLSRLKRMITPYNSKNLLTLVENGDNLLK